MKDFRKVVRIGTTKLYGSPCSVFCKIELKDGRLSISGVEGPNASGNARGGCGQIDTHLSPEQFSKYAKGWSAEGLTKFLEIWDRWHLNDMKAGTPKQREVLSKHRGVHGTWPDYGQALKLLEKAGLKTDAGYTYGSSWLREEVPEDVLAWLQALPDTDKTPAWV